MRTAPQVLIQKMQSSTGVGIRENEYKNQSGARDKKGLDTAVKQNIPEIECLARKEILVRQKIGYPVNSRVVVT